VPGFSIHLSDSDDEDEGEDMDPVSSLWRCLRKGTPLMTIYNSLQPAEPLQMDEATAAKNPKKPAFKFVEACLRDLKLPPGECFTLSDLFGDDTTGFVKVCENHRLTPSQYLHGGHEIPVFNRVMNMADYPRFYDRFSSANTCLPRSPKL
jgi:hypothetical protein